MANQRKNNNKMNMNMSRPSMLWLYGLIGAFIIGYYVFGDVNDTPVPSDWATVERMVEKGEVEKIQVVNRDQAQVFLKKKRSSSTAGIRWTNAFAGSPRRVCSSSSRSGRSTRSVKT